MDIKTTEKHHRVQVKVLRQDPTVLSYLKLGASLFVYVDNGRAPEFVMQIVDDFELDTARLPISAFVAKRTSPNLNESVGTSLRRRLFEDGMLLRWMRFHIIVQLC